MSRIATVVLASLTLVASSAAAAADSGSITFNGQTYTLQSKNASPNEVLNEYIPTNQTLDAWTHLISVRWFPELNDRKAAVGTLIKTLLAQYPDARYAAWELAEAQSTGVDFVTAEGDLVEFNIFIYKPHPSGKGLLAHQVALRAYGDDRLPFMQNLRTTRADMLQKVVDFTFPEVIGE